MRFIKYLEWQNKRPTHAQLIVAQIILGPENPADFEAIRRLLQLEVEAEENKWRKEYPDLGEDFPRLRVSDTAIVRTIRLLAKPV